MPAQRPQYYPNNLKPVDITKDSLREVLRELRTAAKRGADLVQHGSPAGERSKAGLFNGPLGTYYHHSCRNLCSDDDILSFIDSI